MECRSASNHFYQIISSSQMLRYFKNVNYIFPAADCDLFKFLFVVFCSINSPELNNIWFPII